MSTIIKSIQTLKLHEKVYAHGLGFFLNLLRQCCSPLQKDTATHAGKLSSIAQWLEQIPFRGLACKMAMRS